jgi:O-acetylhomoserine (thiol)-lyase
VSDIRLYGGTYNLFENTLAQNGIQTTFVDGSDPQNYQNAIRPNTKAFFLETLGNPNSTVSDMEAIANIAHDNGLPLIVDNTFATPYLFRPIQHGADIVVHSATKFIGGHGTVLGGVIIESGKFDWAASNKFPGLSQPNPSYHGVVFTQAAKELAYIMKARVTLMRDTGASLSPFHSFLFLQGLETLSLRVERHVQNALKVVSYLSAHPKVEAVNHPSVSTRPDNALYQRYFPNGAGSIFTF